MCRTFFIRGCEKFLPAADGQVELRAGVLPGNCANNHDDDSNKENDERDSVHPVHQKHVGIARRRGVWFAEVEVGCYLAQD